MRITLSEVAAQLAVDFGGFTLWVGAGASIALTKGRTPGWGALVGQIELEHKALRPRSSEDMPQQIEWLSQRIGHAALRRALRQRLVDPIESADLDADVFVAQALIGARAAALVSFNIEHLTAMPFVGARNGTTFIGRTFRERSSFLLQVGITTKAGITSPPVYFPHGLLSQGNVVMTQSEYEKHMGSLAMSTAVHLAIGGDLLIVGMSLADQYLRAAILQNRRWLRRIWWLGVNNDYLEWSRVADVTFVESPHSEIWSVLGESILVADKSGELARAEAELRSTGLAKLRKAAEELRLLSSRIEIHGRDLLRLPNVSDEKITEFAEYCQAAGFDIPDIVKQDPRCRL